MYHAVVRARVRALWARVGAGDYRAAVDAAAPDVHFRFVGPPPVGADVRGREAFATWFTTVFRLLPGLRLTPEAIAVSGAPWRTTVVVRLRVEATLDDGSPYRNEAVQWMTLRWGRLTEDLVWEDTAHLAATLDRQQRAVTEGPGAAAHPPR
jgi:ketosteroid isomerase-like protein